MIEQEAHILEAKEPGVGRGSSAIHDPVCTILDSLEAVFSRILMLLMWFTLPITNKECMKNVLYLLADLDLGIIAD